jgi:hypothetical protein
MKKIGVVVVGLAVVAVGLGSAVGAMAGNVMPASSVTKAEVEASLQSNPPCPAGTIVDKTVWADVEPMLAHSIEADWKADHPGEAVPTPVIEPLDQVVVAVDRIDAPEGMTLIVNCGIEQDGDPVGLGDEGFYAPTANMPKNMGSLPRTDA